MGGYAAIVENEAPATFEGPTGSLRIGVERYQFPEITGDDWDSNWLIINGDAVLDGKSWTFRDACLTTFEMERLADWLDQVSSGKVENAFCGFTEPNLDFERVSDVAVRIAFSLEALPPWSKRDSDFGEIGFNVPIDNRVGAAANSLRALLTRYPVRARDGG
ncbi:hypothetical protein IAG41_05475 [Sphingomonas sp. JC676]|uniref:WapI family immunity protein n=1 Tax=Sphingomonas sp. JC676 TaxID=2768065 RepID=UPI00165860CB|nr:hypothetical protein [Sphingomonas sp. JC676]MBC9031834.1 hypothetical protein [Sphingomonas sp. JC676]